MINISTAIASIIPLLMPFSVDQGEKQEIELPPIPTVARQQVIDQHNFYPEVVIKTRVEEKVVYKEKTVYVDKESGETVDTKEKEITEEEYKEKEPEPVKEEVQEKEQEKVEPVEKEVEPEPVKKETKEDTQSVSNQSQNFEFTAYSHDPSEAQSQRYNGRIITATGKDVTDSIYYQGYRIIAVNPDVIPYGSILSVSVNGQSFEAIALDTGGAIRSRTNRIDLMVNDTDEAFAFGVQQGSISYVRKGW